MNLSELSNNELADQLYQEVIYYRDDLNNLCHKIQNQIPRKLMMRLISHLYRIRTQK